jgi:hypothetical protein
MGFNSAFKGLILKAIAGVSVSVLGSEVAIKQEFL